MGRPSSLAVIEPMTTRRIQRAALGVRVGGGGRFAGGSIGSGGVGARVGPVSVRTGGNGSRGNPIGWMFGAVIVVTLVMLLLPVALLSFSWWAYRRWARSGRLPFRRLAIGEKASIIAAALAVPVAVVWAVVVWGGTYTNMTSFAELPYVQGDSVAEATATLEGAGFTVGDVAPTYANEAVNSDCEVRNVEAATSGRQADKRVPVVLKARC